MEHVTIDERKILGETMLKDYLERIGEATTYLIGTIEGFRRDAHTSSHSDSEVFAHLENTKQHLAAPILRDGESFKALADTLSGGLDMLDGSIGIGNPGSEEVKEKTLTEINIIHENLMDISKAAHGLFELLQDGARVFYGFNGDNVSTGYVDADISFDEDSLNVSSATARAISERAVRLDIDVVQGMERVER